MCNTTVLNVVFVAFQVFLLQVSFVICYLLTTYLVHKLLIYENLELSFDLYELQHYITTLDRAIVTIECQYEVVCALSHGDISNDVDGHLTRFSRSRHF